MIAKQPAFRRLSVGFAAARTSTTFMRKCLLNLATHHLVDFGENNGGKRVNHDRRKKFLDTVSQKNATVRLQLEQHYEQQVEDTMARELETGAHSFSSTYSWIVI